MDDDHEVSPGLQRAIEETRAAIEASFDGGDAAQPKIRCLIDQLKADLARVVAKIEELEAALSQAAETAPPSPTSSGLPPL